MSSLDSKLAEQVPKKDPQPSKPPRPTRERLLPLLEALLFVSGRALSADSLAQAIPGVGKIGVERAMDALGKQLLDQQRGLRLGRVAGGYRLETNPDFAPYIARLGKIRREELLSRAALETLAVVAYRQEITKAEIEAIRGVDASSSLRLLLDRSLIRVAGRAKRPGRPLLYATSRRFLERFGLNSLEDLPPQPELPGQLPRALLPKDTTDS